MPVCYAGVRRGSLLSRRLGAALVAENHERMYEFLGSLLG